MIAISFTSTYTSKYIYLCHMDPSAKLGCQTIIELDPSILNLESWLDLALVLLLLGNDLV